MSPRPRVRTALLCAQLLLASHAWARPPADAPVEGTPAQTEEERRAADLFGQGNEQYNAGNFREAITLFSRANALVPHHATLFSIARCHENLGATALALEFYAKALDAAGDASAREDIRRRMDRLRTRPVKVFVSTRPPGALLTVDGRAKPEQGKTPTVVALTPGEHVLLLEMKGHQLVARRVEVLPGTELAVDVPLAPLPRPAPAPGPGTGKPAPLLQESDWRLHLTLDGPMGFGTRRPFTIGAGLQVRGVYRRFLLGGRFWGQAMVFQEIPPRTVDDSTTTHVTSSTYDRSALEWYMGQVLAGYLVPFHHFFLHVDLGLGISYEQATFQGDRTLTDSSGNKTFENVKDTTSALAFAWSLGGGVEAMAASWVSLGLGVQLGMLHGRRPDLLKPQRLLDDTNFMFATLAASISFHLQ